jgi:hypothetical protein
VTLSVLCSAAGLSTEWVIGMWLDVIGMAIWQYGNMCDWCSAVLHMFLFGAMNPCPVGWCELRGKGMMTIRSILEWTIVHAKSQHIRPRKNHLRLWSSLM